MTRPRRVTLVALLGVLLAAFALRLQSLGVQSLWYDETVSAFLAAQPLPALVAHTARDIHPPLYYVLLHFWRGFVGSSEFGLAFFSLVWGVLLVASTATLARWLGGRSAALLTAALLALSPFNVWYSQEVRMYTLGATLGVWTLLALWRLLRGQRMKKRWMTLWLVSAAAGLYTLYYFAFLLLAEALVVAFWLWRTRAPTQRWRRWLTLGAGVALLWSPWLPIALRQATEPPVPPWRQGTPVGAALLETLTALALGQSAPYRLLWPMIALLAVVLVVGLWLCWRQKHPRLPLLLLGSTLVVPMLVLVASSYTPVPLYHVRYAFTYSPAFYVLLALAFLGWGRVAYRRTGIGGAIVAALVLLTPLLVLSGESLQRFWSDPLYAADDLRGGVEQVEQSWRANDVLLVNAGYAYTALAPYFDDPIAWQGRLSAWQAGVGDTPGLVVLQSGSIGGAPSLGWGLPESDFYATTADETIETLERVAASQARLWHFRLYDTVTDPDGVIRRWLDEHALLFHDQLLTGESNGRVQGWLFPPPPGSAPERRFQSQFLDPDGGTPWLTLHGVDEPVGMLAGGGWADITLWLEGHEAMAPDTRLSLGLFDTTPARRQWRVADEQPLGPLLSLREVEGVQRWTVRLRLPQGIPPGKYDALLKFYRPGDGAVLPAQGERVEPGGQQVKVAVVEVGPTPPLDRPPQVGTPLEARFGPLQLLGHAIPAGPWEPGASIAVELTWRKLEPSSDVRAFVTSDVLLSDDGGLAISYPPDAWHVGEVVRDVHYVTVAPNAAPGEYPLFLRVSQGATTIPWTQGLFRTGDVLQLGSLTVVDRPRTFEPPPMETPLDVTFGDSIQLVGATLPSGPFRPNEGVPLTLHWYADARPAGRYKIFTHLIGPDGNLQAQRDLEPGDGRLPTNGWARGEYVTTQYETEPLPPGAPPGRYELRVGLYDPNTNERVLPVGLGVNGAERYLVLTTVEVTSTDE